jgi:sec-independent protein translocase protein TatB
VLDFSWSHILVLLIVALVVVGPKDLPRLMHMIGRWVGKARGMANDFRKSFDEMARASELEDLRKEIEALRATRVEQPVDHAIAPPPASEPPPP